MAFTRQNPRIPEGINASDENPLKEFFLLLAGIGLVVVLLLAGLMIFAQTLAAYIPFEYEQRLVQQIDWSPATVAENRGSADDAQLQQAETALRELGQSLARSADLPDGMTLRFHLVTAPEVPNAFATLGGNIFVTTGLLETVSSENALSMVLAHEIAHVSERHPIQALGRGMIVQITLGMLFGGNTAGSLESLLTQTGMLTLLSFNRQMETDADTIALQTLKHHYGHLSGADEFFARMQVDQSAPRWTEFLQTHPDVNKRLQAIRTAISESGSAGTKVTASLTPLPEALRLP